MMSTTVALGLWLALLAAVAALAVERRAARAGFALALVALAVPFLVDGGPLALAGLALAFVWTAVRAADLAFGAAPARFGARLLHLCAVVDVRDLTPAPSRIDRDALARAAVAGAIAASAVALLGALPPGTTASGLAQRTVAGAAFALATAEFLMSLIALVIAAAGRSTPALHDHPHLARSVGEFWARRWNRVVSRALAEHAFRRARRAGPTAALAAPFALSAAIHAYLIGPAAGAQAAACWAAFFLAQAPLVLLERRWAIRTWPGWAARTWTLGSLLLLAPLFLEPAFGVLGL
jgi:hypothetical protein